MKGTKKLGEYEDWEVFDGTLQLVIFLAVTEISEIFTVRPPNWRSDDKQE